MCNISSGTQLRMSTCLSMKVRIMVYSFLIMSWRRSKNTFYSATTFWLFKAWSKLFWSFYLDSQSDDPGLVFSDCKLKFWKYTWNHYNRTRVFGTRNKVYLGLSKYELSHFRRHWTYVWVWFQWAFNVIIMS